MASQSKSLSSVPRWHPANSHQLTVYIFQFSDGFPAGSQGLFVLPHFQTGQYGLHVIGKSVDFEPDLFHESLPWAAVGGKGSNVTILLQVERSRQENVGMDMFMRGTYLGEYLWTDRSRSRRGWLTGDMLAPSPVTREIG